MRHSTLSTTQIPGIAKSTAATDHVVRNLSDEASTVARAGLLNVLHVTATVGRKSFGVGAAALSLAGAQRSLGHHVENWSADTADELAEMCPGQPTMDREDCCRVGDVYGFGKLGSGQWVFFPSMYRAVVDPRGANFQVLHQHSIWSACSLATRRWRRWHHRPTVISPQGTLDAWALRKSKLKKWLAGHLFEQENLHSASCIHAVSAREVVACRDFGLRNPVALVPNAVSGSWLVSHGEGGRFRRDFDIPSSVRIMLFLSRVTPKKGLTMLFEAIADVGSRFDDWLLVVAGPDEFGHTRELAELATSLGINQRIRLVGPLYGQTRRDAFAAAELFVLPTYSEGHPIAALEALGVGLPVLTTTGAYCDFIHAQKCGWQTEIDTASLREGLLAVLGCGSPELATMGERGKKYVEDNLTWDIAAQRMIALYYWLCDLAPQPDFVSVD